MPINSQRRRAFTLVELLVVIGIIALLVSILLPSLNKARQAAVTVKCESNLKQIGIAVGLYVADNKGKLPYGQISNQQNPPPNHAPGDYSYIDDSPIVGLVALKYLPQYPMETVWRNTLSGPRFSPKVESAPGVLRCPAGADKMCTSPDTYAPVDVQFRTCRWRSSAHPGTLVAAPTMVYCDGCDKASSYSYENPVYTDYVLNTETSRQYNPNGLGVPLDIIPYPPIGGGYTYTSGFGMSEADSNGTITYSTGQIAMGQVRMPAQTWLGFDGNDLTGSNGSAACTWRDACFRHPNNSCNFLYYDGHVENLDTEHIEGAYSYVTAVSMPYYAPFDKRACIQQQH